MTLLNSSPRGLSGVMKGLSTRKTKSNFDSSANRAFFDEPVDVDASVPRRLWLTPTELVVADADQYRAQL
jgi:hypothetical protein